MPKNLPLARLNPTILHEAAQAAQPIAQPIQSGGIRGPALVYEGWNGESCGNAHNFPALEQAANQLGVPLYVINLDVDKPLDATRPGQRINSKDFGQVIGMVSKYDLMLQDPHVRLIDRNDKVTGPQDITSGHGAKAIVDAFAPLVKQMRGKAEINGHGRQ